MEAKYTVIRDIEQGTPEWLEMRRGVITGTRLKDVMGTSDKRYKLLYEIVGELLVEPKQAKATAAMQRGKELEPLIKKSFPLFEEVGFIKSTENPAIGISPDGVFIPDTDTGIITQGLEIKAPEIKNFLTYWVEKYVREREDLATMDLFKKKLNKTQIPDDYLWQVVHYFLVVNTIDTMVFAFGNPDIGYDGHEANTILVTREEMQEYIDKANEALKAFFVDVEIIKKIFLENASDILLEKDEDDSECVYGG